MFTVDRSYGAKTVFEMENPAAEVRGGGRRKPGDTIRRRAGKTRGGVVRLNRLPSAAARAVAPSPGASLPPSPTSPGPTGPSAAPPTAGAHLHDLKLV